MDAKRETYSDAGHGLRGPHGELPVGFVPLRLRVVAARAAVAVNVAQALVGRHSDTDVRLADPEVSRHHCWLHYDHGQWRVTDLNSLNGVFVNGERVPDAVLYEGDELRLGGVRLHVEAATPVRVHPADSAEAEVLRRIAGVLPDTAAG